MPSYLSKGVKQVKMAEHVIEALPEPNRQHAKDFESYMQVLNRNPRTIWRRLYEIAWLLQRLGKDAKQATKKDIERLVLQINSSSKAEISKTKLKITLKRFYKWLYDSNNSGPCVLDQSSTQQVCSIDFKAVWLCFSVLFAAK